MGPYLIWQDRACPQYSEISTRTVNSFSFIFKLLAIPWMWSVFIWIISFEFNISNWVYSQTTCDKSQADNTLFSGLYFSSSAGLKKIFQNIQFKLGHSTIFLIQRWQGKCLGSVRARAIKGVKHNTKGSHDKLDCRLCFGPKTHPGMSQSFTLVLLY